MKTKLLLAFCLAGCMAKAQIISTVAGDNSEGYCCDGSQSTSAELYHPTGMAFDVERNGYIADWENNRIRKVNTSGIISTFAGSGGEGFSGDGGQATAAELNEPTQIAFDALGNMYIADLYNYRIRKVTTAGVISTYAGNGTAGYSGDGGQATAAKLNEPYAVTCDAAGSLYIVDFGNSRIRKVTTAGIISTFVGNGTAGFSGDGGQATAAELNSPDGITIDGAGNLYIADLGNGKIRKVNTSGIISTIVGNGTAGFSGDGGQATAAELNEPNGIAIDVIGNLYVGDLGNNRIRMINPSGIISTFAGNGTAGFSGDGGQATAAELYQPYGVALDIYGNLYIADFQNNRIRKVTVPCPANAGSNVTDYDNSGTVCAAVAIGTASVSGVTYAWSPTTALSCTNCAQPNCSYDNTVTPQVYTVTVSGTGCTTATSTVQVTTLTPTITASCGTATAINGSNITVVGNYSANFTPAYYYWAITQCTATGGTVTPAYSWNNGWGPLEPSGYTFTFPNTNTLTCNTYYSISFGVGTNSCAYSWTGPPILYTTLDANFMITATDINSSTFTASAVYPTDNPTGSAGFGYYWDVQQVGVSGTEVSNPSCWWTAPSNCHFNGYNGTSTLTSPCSSAGDFTTNDYYDVSFAVWSTACAWTETTQEITVCVGACREENPTGFISNPVINGPDHSSYLQTLQNPSSPNTGINNIPVISIYPNPNNGSFVIESNSSLPQLIQIYDVNGKQVLSQTINGRATIDASSLPDGVYNINSTGNNTVANKKLVIVR